ncbi:MAG: pyridoxamine 5'-phosphate oxidase family protein [Planctomycetota bacterium]
MSAAVWRLAGLSAAEIWSRLAAELARAASSARHPLHLVTVATLGADGGPRARTVVLRGFDAERRVVCFHTDSRSPKAAEITRDGRVALHWYDAEARLQIRIPAEAVVHHGDAVASAAWQAALSMSRACYASPTPPGTRLAAFPAAAPAPTAADDRGLAHFAVVRCRFAAVELLALHASGHERMLLEIAGAVPTGTILAP